MAFEKQDWGQAAPRFRLDDLLAAREETNRVRVDFLKTDLQTALTFLKVARQTNDDVRRRRCSRAARHAYETVAKLAPTVILSAQETQLVQRGLAYLRTELCDLGEVF